MLGELMPRRASGRNSSPRGGPSEAPGQEADEAGFAAWRQDALFALGGELLQAVAQILAGTWLVAAAKESQPKVLGAQTLLQAFAAAGLGADCGSASPVPSPATDLDPDPSRLADLPAALERARRVIDIDLATSRRQFLLAATTTMPRSSWSLPRRGPQRLSDPSSPGRPRTPSG